VFLVACGSPRHPGLAFAELQFSFGTSTARLHADGRLELGSPSPGIAITREGAVLVSGRPDGALGGDGWFRSRRGEKRFLLEGTVLVDPRRGRFTLDPDGKLVGNCRQEISVRGANDRETRRTALLVIGLTLDLISLGESLGATGCK
jgi:hypothetical protein